MREFEGLHIRDRVRGQLTGTDAERRLSDFARAKRAGFSTGGETYVLNCPIEPSILDSDGKGDIL